MLPKLVKAEHIEDYRIWIAFSDGTEGEVDLGNELWGEMFEPLQNQEEFSKCKLDEELGTVVWPNGADFAPEFLYQLLKPEYTLKPPSETGAT